MTRFENRDAPSLPKKILSQFLLACGGALVVFAFFFGVFANSLDTEVGDVPAADGIVVFTGTARARISAGLDMLARGKGPPGVVLSQFLDTARQFAGHPPTTH